MSARRGPLGRRAHRLLGLALALPFFGWAATGLVFFLKPGYGDAYAALAAPVRPLEGPRTISPGADALEVRWLATPLGQHLLVRGPNGWRHLRASTGGEWREPGETELRPFVAAAIAADRERYGELLGREAGGEWRTATGVRIRLDWPTLALAQRGRDTAAIELAYRIHYLQWTGVASIDRALGLLGLLGVAVLAGLGLRLARRG